jgi:hypothetical protein
MTKTSKTNPMARYTIELSYRASALMDKVATEHLKSGGTFEPKKASKTIMDCLNWARMVTDILAAHELLYPYEEIEPASPPPPPNVVDEPKEPTCNP